MPLATQITVTLLSYQNQIAPYIRWGWLAAVSAALVRYASLINV